MSDDDDSGRLAELPVSRRRPRKAARRQVPEGKIEVVVTYLEMSERPTRAPAPHPPGKIALMRLDRPTVSFYRYLYNTVGADWLWYERRILDDDALRRVIHDPAVEIFVLYVHGTPAGYVELDRRHREQVEIAYFGLIPEFLGRGFGQYLLDWAVDEAWGKEPERVWLHTCNFDHPRAIASYQRSGFVPFKQETMLIDDPRLDGTLPAGAGR